MTDYPQRSTMAVWPPVLADSELTVAGLTADGAHVQGWVRKPQEGVWHPSDLLWLPPTAVKSTDIDRAGRVVDVIGGPGELDWVTAELNKHERYLEVLRHKVRAGALRLTASMAKMLGLPYDDGVSLEERARSDSAARLAALLGRQLSGARQ